MKKKKKKQVRVAYLPSLEQIELETAAIQLKWNKALHLKRMGGVERLTVKLMFMVNDGRVIRK